MYASAKSVLVSNMMNMARRVEVDMPCWRARVRMAASASGIDGVVVVDVDGIVVEEEEEEDCQAAPTSHQRPMKMKEKKRREK